MTRTVLVVFGLLDVGTGAWALLAPSGWYADYPGLGRHWVSGSGPFNEHLASDAGAGFLAVGVAMLLAAVLMSRATVQLALLAFLAQALPHFAFHVTHSDTSLGAVDVVVGVWGIGAQCAVVAALLVLTARRSSARLPAAPGAGEADGASGGGRRPSGGSASSPQP